MRNWLNVWRRRVLAALIWVCAAAGGNLEMLGGELPARFVVKEFRFSGNTVFSSEKLSALTAPYTNRVITILDLEAARIAVTTNYVENGYVNSGARIRPPGPDGVVEVQVVEGRLTEARVTGNRWVRDGFYLRRLRLDDDKPLNVYRLRDRLDSWRELYPIRRINGDLRPGLAPGEGVLEVALEETFPYRFSVEYANDRPPSSGAEQVTGVFEAESLTRNGDRLDVRQGVARGRSPGLRRADWLGWDDFSAAYEIPVTARDLSLGAHYARSSASIVEARFAELDIESELEALGVTARQPLIRGPRREFSVSLTAERKQSRTFLLGEPYSLSDGAEDGESVLSVLRLGAQHVERSSKQVFAMRLALSAGLDALGATKNSRGPDGRFVSVLGQGNYALRLGETGHQFVLRGFGQYTPEALLAPEQMSLGGSGSVRGYRENTLVRDSALFGAMELKLTLFADSAGQPRVQWIPFVSYGRGWDRDRSSPPPNGIASAGAGLAVHFHRMLEGSVFWGHPFRSVDYEEEDMQDLGLHFRIIFKPL